MKCRAYRLLAHAEFENYFESYGKELAKKAKAQWDERQFASKTLLCILAFSDRNMGRPPESLTPKQNNQTKSLNKQLDISERVNDAINDYRKVVDGNHGIKEKNIISLLLPVGVSPIEIENTSLVCFDDYGKTRGLWAHSSIGIIYKPNPKDEIKRVDQLLKELQSIDSVLQEIESSLDSTSQLLPP